MAVDVVQADFLLDLIRFRLLIQHVPGAAIGERDVLVPQIRA
jgi:hypothetical protein